MFFFVLQWVKLKTNLQFLAIGGFPATKIIGLSSLHACFWQRVPLSTTASQAGISLKSQSFARPSTQGHEKKVQAKSGLCHMPKNINKGCNIGHLPLK